MKKHSRYYYSLLISCLIIMSSCQPKPSSLLKEAMKMENNINADKDGKITAINVNKGDSVLEGNDLVIIE